MPSKGQTYDSSGPDIRVRGNAYQVLEKYLQLARDAGTMGDRVAAENFLQHADHYYRVVASMNEGRRPQIGGRDVSVADVNVHNVNQGLSAALSGHGHSNPSADDNGSDPQPGNGPGNNSGNERGNNQGGGSSGGQHRPQQHQQQAPREAHNSGSGQNGEHPSMGSAESSGNSEDAPQGQQANEQPDYPDELLPAEAAAPNGDGAQGENRQHNRMGRGRRRGPGRRIRNDGDNAPEGSSTPDSDGAQ
jgi:hypothetical protein